MRILKGLAAGALAICGLAFMQAPASARPISAPELIQVSTVQPDRSADSATSCHRPFYGRQHWRYRPYHRWHRLGYHPYCGWHRPFYRYHRPFYGWHRSYGWHHGWRHRW